MCVTLKCLNSARRGWAICPFLLSLVLPHNCDATNWELHLLSQDFAALCVCCLACPNNWFMHSQVSTTRRQFVLTILRQIQTPQEVVDWFGCGHGKKKELLWLGKQTIWFLTCVGKNKKKMIKQCPSYPGSCTARVRILIAGIERVQ